MLNTVSLRRLLVGGWLFVAAAACGEKPAAPPPAAAVGNKTTPLTALDKSDTWLSNHGDGDEPLPEPAEDPMTATILKPWTGDLDGMIERRVIRVLTTYSKTSFFVDKGSERGLIADAMRLFEDDLNKRLASQKKGKNKNIRIHVTFIPVAHDDLIPALLEGRGDIVAAGKLATEWRKEQVDFTIPTQTNISSVIVTGPGVPPLNSVQELSGRDVYIRESDVSAENVKKFNAALAAAAKPPVKIIPAPEVLADEDLLEMVNAGLVPATMVDDYIAAFWKQIFPGIVLNTKAAVRTDGQTAMMIRKNSPQLMKELNAFIARYPKGSATRNVLFQKYLKSVKYVKAATSKEEVARFERTVGFIRKYSDQYNMDFLLMAAQGYQESGLDQNRKSPVGAVGVMQVMPATGADMKVGDIKQMEPNIHAGVKYMRFMMDNFYADTPMTPLNKALFTFASYNAGPGRLRQLRERAKKRGLDENRWFNNVEVIAAERIGRETVQYVSNIYKYYLAYKLLADQRDARMKAKQP
jgi:membrane-bound lytic murein transglycosylase MltF